LSSRSQLPDIILLFFRERAESVFSFAGAVGCPTFGEADPRGPGACPQLIPLYYNTLTFSTSLYHIYAAVKKTIDTISFFFFQGTSRKRVLLRSGHWQPNLRRSRPRGSGGLPQLIPLYYNTQTFSLLFKLYKLHSKSKRASLKI
jgi:hypothetical protein